MVGGGTGVAGLWLDEGLIHGSSGTALALYLPFSPFHPFSLSLSLSLSLIARFTLATKQRG
jgi:hypothetical protein